MTIATVAANEQARPAPSVKYLYNPLVDFLLLGGGSLLLLPIVALAYPGPERPVTIAAIALLIAHVVNHPHFAHSYQIFYNRFLDKLTNKNLPASLRARYLIAGVIVPLLLALYFCISIARSDLVMLGLAANAMALLVGWHYVKQGYGMLIVDSVLKRHFFSHRQKLVFQVNCYAVWAYAWMHVNTEVAKLELWNLKYYAFALPEWLTTLAMICMAASTVAAIFVIARDFATRADPRPWNGLVAYLTTLYLWTAFVTLNPAILLLVPAFHSLQYLAIVWRFKSNAITSDASSGHRPMIRILGKAGPKMSVVRFANFSLLGVLLGFLGFWWLPQKLDAMIAYDQALFGPTLFLFVFWLFINVHHYFLDNVMWRAENPEARRYLFAPPSAV